MKGRILGVLLIILLLLPIGCTRSGATTPLTIPTAPSPQVLAEQGFQFPNLPRITCEELKQKMDEGNSLILVDDNEREQFNQGHLPGAINIPRYDPEETVATQLKTLPRDRLIVFYCT